MCTSSSCSDTLIGTGTILRRLVARYRDVITVIHSGNTGVPSSFGLGCRYLGIKAEMHSLDWYCGIGSIVRNERTIAAAAGARHSHSQPLTTPDS